MEGGENGRSNDIVKSSRVMKEFISKLRNIYVNRTCIYVPH